MLTRFWVHAAAAVAALAPQTAVAVWQTPVTNYTRTDYGAGTQNWCIAQRADGWVYAANNYGLLEYDGSRWDLYGLWNSSAMRSICVTDDGDIFAGGYNEFGLFESDGLGNLRYEPISTGLGEGEREFGDIWGVMTRGDNAYFTTHTTIYVYDRVSKAVRKVQSSAHIIDSAIVGDSLFVLRTDGIFRLSGSSFSDAIAGSEALAAEGLITTCAHGGKLYVGTAKGLYAYSAGKIERVMTEADDYVGRNTLYSLAVNDSYIAQGTVMGGVALTRADGTKPRFFTTANGMQNNTILSLMFDQSANLWCGLDNGIDCVEMDSPMSQLYGTLSEYGTGYTSIADGDVLYIGTNRGLFKSPFPIDDSQPTFNGSLIEGSIGQVWNLAKIGGHILCCHNNGLFELAGHEAMKPICKTDGFWLVRPFPLAESVALAGGYDGLYVLRVTPDGVKIANKLEGSPKQARTFEIDSNNRVWICTERGLERVTISHDMTHCSTEMIMEKPKDGTVYLNVMKFDGRILVSMGNHSYMTDDNNELTDDDSLLNLLDGPNAFYTCLSKDKDGNLWYITNNALKVRLLTPQTGQYATKSTLVWDLPQFYAYGFTELRTIGDGQAIVSCIQGFALADVKNAIVKNRQMRPKLFIRQLTSISAGEEGVIYGASFPERKQDIKIPFNRNSIKFEYGCTQSFEKDLKYSCALSSDGEGEFSEWSGQTEKEYTYLSPGEYTFSVRVRHDDGEIAARTSMTFTITPPWWLTWWAKAAYAVMALAAAWAASMAVRVHNRNAQDRVARQKEEEMRKQQEAYAQQNLLRDKLILQLKNEKIEDELKSKSQELSQMMLSALDRNELITRVKRDLTKVQEDLLAADAKQASKRLAQMQNKLAQDANTRVDWERFEQNFDIVNDSFMRKLQAKFPWISTNEKRLCVYIIMGMQNKEIAPLMNISVRGVEMLRYRLRKKMDMQREDDLTTALRAVRDED